jgi:hypothetical protein
MWKENKFGNYCKVADPDVIIKDRGHFASKDLADWKSEVAKEMECSFDSLVDCHVISIGGSDVAAINVHYLLTLVGDILRADLCVAYLDKLSEPHPTIELDTIYEPWLPVILKGRGRFYR